MAASNCKVVHFTGCDYTSAFVRKGKVRPYSILSKSPQFQRAFASLTHADPTTEMVKLIQDFVCVLYGMKKMVPLNKHRFDVVSQTYTKKAKASHPFDKLKHIDGSSIPPCEAELAPHIDRSAFVARMWGAAHCQYLDKIPAAGWEKVDDKLSITWFDGPQLPAELVPELKVTSEEQGIVQSVESEEAEEDETDEEESVNLTTSDEDDDEQSDSDIENEELIEYLELWN